ncbi:MAG: signal peptidase II [Mycobacteriales bacterium]
MRGRYHGPCRAELGAVYWRKPTGIFAAMGLLVLAVDAATKVWVVATRIDQPPVRLLGGWVYVTHLRNTGAAFNIGDGFTVLLSLAAIAVVIYVAWLSRRLVSPVWAVALGLIAGGASGNLVDRFLRDPGPLRGGVVDFISLADPTNPPWPVFNVADSALVAGVTLLVAVELFGRGSGFRPRNSGSTASTTPTTSTASDSGAA